MSRKPSPRRGNVGAGGSPSGAFKCADGLIVLTVGNDLQWQRFCIAIDRAEMASDPRFITATGRIENREALSPVLEAMFAAKSKAHWLEVLQTADIPSGPVNELPEVFADPQVRERGMVVSVPHPISGVLDLIASPIRFSETPIDRYEAPPTLGQHTESVLRDLLGVGESELRALKEANII
jgi:crotonobetainyl-CoA:carnitine CoA-transferase CaiB-like acyl-CoA transferase